MSGRAADRLVMVAAGGRTRASSRLRVHAWADRFEAEGVDCDVFCYYDPAWMDREGLSTGVPRLEAALRSPRLWRRVADRVRGARGLLLQEVVPPRRITRALRREVDHLVFDLSDPIHARSGPSRTLLHALVHHRVLVPRIEAMVRVADVTTVENERVGAWVAERGGRVEIVRGPVDTERYRPRPAGDERPGELTLGWTGSAATLPYLESLRPALESLHRDRGGVRLVVFGVERGPEGWSLPVRAIPWNEAEEPGVVAGFDVGLNPQPDTPWGRLRGGAKITIYMACGVPVVSTPAGIADQVLEPGRTGFLAGTTGEWRDVLGRLMDDPGLRARMGARAREEAVGRYGYEVYRPLMRRILLG